MSPAIAAVQRLGRLGFTRLPVLDEDGELDTLIFVRDRQGWREVVLVYSELEARAYRIPAEQAADNPLYVPPGAAQTLTPLADVVTVVHTLLRDKQSDDGDQGNSDNAVRNPKGKLV